MRETPTIYTYYGRGDCGVTLPVFVCEDLYGRTVYTTYASDDYAEVLTRYGTCREATRGRVIGNSKPLRLCTLDEAIEMLTEENTALRAAQAAQDAKDTKKLVAFIKEHT